MNKASGYIHKKSWVLQEGGITKLREDDFGVKIDCLGAVEIEPESTNTLPIIVLDNKLLAQFL